MKLEFSGQVFEKYPNIRFHDCPVRADLFHEDRQTDTTKLIGAFRNFAERV